jgi:fructose-1,6-bisphosphatase/inositol monophosphatase family enzyme
VTFGGDVFISGTLYGATAGGAAGSGGDVQYNNGSGGFAAESQFNYSSITNTLAVGNINVVTSLASNLIPDGDRTRNLGSPAARFANVYTGDLHLRNERGDWTVIEEPDYLTVTNNRTGKRFKILMEPID